MSTRSGKRIHAVSREECSETLIEPKIVRKTRSKQEEESSIFSTKERKNYVRYPSEEEITNNLNDNHEIIAKSNRKSERTTLKEQNFLSTDSELSNDDRKIVRVTRRTKKFDVDDIENAPSIANNKIKGKKKGNKKIESKSIIEATIETDPVIEKVGVTKKKSIKKKKKSKCNSITVENKCNTSLESFHSAAGSPLKMNNKKNKKHLDNGDSSKTIKIDKRNESIPHQDSEMLLMGPSTRSLNENKIGKTSEQFQASNVDSNVGSDIELMKTSEMETIRKSSLRSCSSDQGRVTRLNKTFEIENNNQNIQTECGTKGKKCKTSVDQTKKMTKTTMIDNNLNQTSEPESSMLNSKNNRTSKIKTEYDVEKSSDKIDKDLNTTYEKERKSVLKEETNLDMEDILTQSESISKKRNSKLSICQTKLNGTSLDTMYGAEKSNWEDQSDHNASNVSSIKNISVINLDNTNDEQNSVSMESARKSLRKSLAPISSLNSTYDKISNNILPTLNGTYDKNDEPKQKDTKGDKSERKSSLISSDGSESIMTEDNSHLSITSDESRENIINTTPVLIESSMDESQLIEKTQLKRQGTFTTESPAQNTPLKRQGTFTTESPVQNSPLKRRGTFTTESSEEKSITVEKSLKREGTFNKDTMKKDGTSTDLQSSIPQKPPKNIPLKRQGIIDTVSSSEEKDTPTEKSLKREGTFNKDTTVKKGVTNTELEFMTPQKTPKKTPLKREGTFTTDSSSEEKDTTSRKSFKREALFNKESTLKKDGTDTVLEPMTPLKTPKKTPLKREGTFTTDSSSEEKGTPSKMSLKREGTFDKDTTTLKDCTLPRTPQKTPKKTPLKRLESFAKGEESPKIEILRCKRTPSPGSTPFPFSKEKNDIKMLNVTHSIEKRKSSIMDLPKATMVKFCSPVNTPVVFTQMTRKIIKSSMKGSNKSFVFDESALDVSRAGRKRSYTQSEVEQVHSKRKRLTEDQRNSVDRLSRPRTLSASGKLQDSGTPSKKPTTPSKKVSRTKLPNFAALHQKQFEKMESLDECQERKAKRAKQLLTPTGAVTGLERISPKETQTEQPKPEATKPSGQQTEVTKKHEPLKKHTEKGYTRFGFKLNLDVNPFSIPSKTEVKPKEPELKRQATLPSLAGATIRKNLAKQTVMREKSFTKRREDRKENRTIIKGVRTNRRFELQMKMRNVNDD